MRDLPPTQVDRRVICDGCGERNLLASEAKLSRRVYDGEAFCHHCRELARFFLYGSGAVDKLGVG